MDDDTVDEINANFYNDLSAKTGRKINADPMTYTNNTGDIPYWKMPRLNGKRYTKQELSDNGYFDAEETQNVERLKEQKGFNKWNKRLTNPRIIK